jgi:hypothetical protein
MFSALPPAEAHPETDVPEESRHPASFTARLRRFLMTDPEALFRAGQIQAEYERKVAAADSAARPQN